MRSGVAADVCMLTQRHNRDRNALENLFQQVISAHIVRERFIGKDEPVPDHIQRHIQNVAR